MRRLTFYIALLAVTLGNPIVSMAQFGGSNSSGGGFGGGGGGGGGGGFGSSGGGLGGSGGGGLGGGMGGGLGGGMGSGGLGGGLGGGMGGSTGGIGGSSPFGQTGAAGMNGQQGQQQFLGRNTNAQQQFLGRNVAATGQNGMQNQTNNRRGAGNRNQNQGNNINNQQQGGPAGIRGQASQPPPIRPRQKVAFEYTKPQLATVSTNLEVRINKMTAFKGKNVTISVDPSGEIVLKGTVETSKDAKLAENLVRFEPGVSTVRNELKYPPPIEEE